MEINQNFGPRQNLFCKDTLYNDFLQYVLNVEKGHQLRVLNC